MAIAATSPTSTSPAASSASRSSPAPSPCRSVRYVARQPLHRARSRDRGWSRRVLVVGDASHVLELVHQLRREWYAGYHGGRRLHPGRAHRARCRSTSTAYRWSGRSGNILDAADAVSADTVAVTGSAELTAGRLRRLGWQMEGTGIDLVLAPALTDVAGPRIHTRPVAGLPLIHVESPEFRGARKALKGFVDRPLALRRARCCWRRCCCSSPSRSARQPRPVFFRQTRVGLGGREFDVFKFRSMVVDADAMLAELVGAQRDRRADVQDAQRPAGHPGRRHPAQVVPGRAAAAVQRPDRAT